MRRTLLESAVRGPLTEAAPTPEDEALHDLAKALDARARLVGDAGRDHAAIGMAQQNDVLQVLELQNVQNVLDVRRQVDVGPRQMGALAKARIAR